MFVRVNHPLLDFIMNFCFYGLIIIAFASIIPWRLQDGKNRWSLYLPMIAVLL